MRRVGGRRRLGGHPPSTGFRLPRLHIMKRLPRTRLESVAVVAPSRALNEMASFISLLPDDNATPRQIATLRVDRRGLDGFAARSRRHPSRDGDANRRRRARRGEECARSSVGLIDLFRRESTRSSVGRRTVSQSASVCAWWWLERITKMKKMHRPVTNAKTRGGLLVRRSGRAQAKLHYI